MRSAGIRELRQNASKLLRRVQQGETVEITDRGRPVALLSPIPDGSVLDRLRAIGEVEAATMDPSTLSPPVVLPEGTELPSTVLQHLRDDER